jgi:hypothetical protein
VAAPLRHDRLLPILKGLLSHRDVALEPAELPGLSTKVPEELLDWQE